MPPNPPCFVPSIQSTISGINSVKYRSISHQKSPNPSRSQNTPPRSPEKFLKLGIELGRQGFIMSNDQRRLVQRLDDVGHGEHLAGTGNAPASLPARLTFKKLHNLLNRYRIISVGVHADIISSDSILPIFPIVFLSCVNVTVKMDASAVFSSARTALDNASARNKFHRKRSF